MTRQKTLERVLSKAGLGSRTEARSWIHGDRVRVNGKLIQWNRRVFQLAVRDDDTRAAFESVAGPAQQESSTSPDDNDRLDPRQSLTLGQWGGDL